MEKTKTAVSWLVDEIYRKFGQDYSLTEVVHKAKEMEESQLKNAYRSGARYFSHIRYPAHQINESASYYMKRTYTNENT